MSASYEIRPREMTTPELLETEHRLRFAAVNHPTRRMALLDTVATIRAELAHRLGS